MIPDKYNDSKIEDSDIILYENTVQNPTKYLLTESRRCSCYYMNLTESEPGGTLSYFWGPFLEMLFNLRNHREMMTKLSRRLDRQVRYGCQVENGLRNRLLGTSRMLEV